MRNGIIIRNTPKHTNNIISLSEHDYIIAETSTCADLRKTDHTNKSKYFPMVSAFLGSKTLPIKMHEFRAALSLGTGRILYFIDQRNISYKNFKAFTNELETVLNESAYNNVILYIPVAIFPPILNHLLNFLTKTSFDIMLGFADSTEIEGIYLSEVENLRNKIDPLRISYAFWKNDPQVETIALAQRVSSYNIIV